MIGVNVKFEFFVMDIKHELEIKASAATIYQAASTQKGIQGWWSADCQVGEEEGGTSLLRFNKQGTIIEMGFRTVALEPAAKVVWECTAMPNPAWLGTRIITEISPRETGCAVVFSHVGFDEQWKGKPPFEDTKKTWHHFMQSLITYCEGGEGSPW